MYGLKDPLEYLKIDPPSKSSYKTEVNTKIQSFHEKTLRNLAEKNSAMKFLNVSLFGLNGRSHPALANVITSHQVQKSRIHLKMLAGNFLTFEVKAKQSGGSPHCRSCVSPSIATPPSESLVHMLTKCNAYRDIRSRIVNEYLFLCTISKSRISWQLIISDDDTFCQFVLDPTSFNLKQRIHVNDPILGSLFELSRDYCYAVNSARQKILGSLQNKKQFPTTQHCIDLYDRDVIFGFNK